MEIRLLKAAQGELDEGYIYFEEQVKGLGDEFLDEFLKTLKRIKLNPKAWAPLSKRTRRCLFNRFSYGIIYQIREEELLIVAIAHLHRKTQYWKNRIQ